jgi:16S rRNA (adenine1518-N6/adenine1519-N6)-dimethyltransferase
MSKKEDFSDIKPLKRFGQNYIKDKNILLKIVSEITPKQGENIIEIGPGTGSLTEHLMEKAGQITAFEIDKRVIDDLKKRFPSLIIHQADFTKIDLANYRDEKKIRITGNIPYNITSSIIFKLIGSRNIVEDAVLMVQYEVARRMTAQKGTKDYGILSILLNAFADVKFCFKVSPNVFYPKPKVFSAVVHIYFREKLPPGLDTSLFIKVVKAAFGKRRKILKNSLSDSIFTGVDFNNSGVNLNLRAEQLTLDDFILLTKFLTETNITN